MSKKRGGRKRQHKTKKQYQEYVRNQLKSGNSNDADGNWTLSTNGLRSRALYDGRN